MRIQISIADQRLQLFDGQGCEIRCYAVSTSKHGPGEEFGSYKTPRGRHVVRVKIGAGAPLNAVFVRRRPTGEIYSLQLGEQFPGRDWILTRILWLSGVEVGFNRFGPVDTMRRFIYIHGCPDSAPMGTPGSMGCIRMHNRDVAELFDLVPPYTPIEIVA